MRKGFTRCQAVPRRRRGRDDPCAYAPQGDEGIGTTAENLKEAISGENYEHTSMYPEHRGRQGDGDKEALRSFSWANAVEKIHEEKYKAAAEAVSSGNDLPAKKLYVCPLCGNVEEDEPPEKCRVCGAPGSSFKEVM